MTARRASRTTQCSTNPAPLSRGFTIVELLIVIVVIAILAAITIVAYNGVSNQAKLAVMKDELAQWRQKAGVHRVEKTINDCPGGYVFVYGNPTFGTSDFCVMKYEAKNVGGIATSQASDPPWVSVSQTDAMSAATAAGGHLITEAEWMTIAADILSVKYNWSGGAVGSGYVLQGHVNNGPASPLAASDDNFDWNYGINGGSGGASGTNSSRVLWLKSGEGIWDISGNVWEWTSATITGAQPGTSGYVWREYPAISSWGALPTMSRPSALSGEPGLLNIGTWDSSKGVGQIYSSSSETGTRGLMRGGHWFYMTSAGVLSLNLANTQGYTNSAVGFRVTRQN